MSWTDERVERLKELWNEQGFSGSECAKELGGGVTREAVIGKVRRLRSSGVEMRGDDTAQKKVARKPKKTSGDKASAAKKMSKPQAKAEEVQELPKMTGQISGTPRYTSILDVPDTVAEGRPHQFMCMNIVTSEKGKEGICGNQAMYDTAHDVSHATRSTRKNNCNKCFSQFRKPGTAILPKKKQPQPRQLHEPRFILRQ